MAMNRFLTQTVVLTKKNMILQWRNKTSTCVQIAIGVLFLILLVIMQAAINANSADSTQFSLVTTPKVLDTQQKYKCTPGPLNDTCFSLIYAPFTTEVDLTANENMENVTTAFLNSYGLPTTRGEKFGALRLENATEVDQFFLKFPNVTRAAVIFQNSRQWGNPAERTFRYILQVNETVECRVLGIADCEDIFREVRIPVQTGIDAAFITVFGSNAENSKINATFSDFPKPQLATSFDVVNNYGAAFLYIAITFNYVIQLSLIVQEKELHLIDSLTQVGLMKSAYYLSWVINNTIINTLMVFFLLITGNVLQFSVFKETDFLLMITLLWMSTMTFTFLALFFSTLTRKTSNARLIGIVVFIVTFIAAPIMVNIFFSDPSVGYNSWRIGTSFFPMFPFFMIMDKYIRGSAGVADGLAWEDRKSNVLNFDATQPVQQTWSIEQSFLYLIAAMVIYSIATWYFDAVIPTENGRRLPLYFPCMPTYWLGKRGSCRGRKRLSGEAQAITPNRPVPEKFLAELDEDVRAEAMRVYRNDFSGRNPAVVMDEMCKTFGSFKAVDRVSYAIDKDQLFVILGHNGAGKSTTFNMLTGLTHVSSGDAVIFGFSVKDDMSELHKRMGVCPQHDVLWGQLTAREHLRMFGRIKGIAGAELEAEVEARLKQVNLIGSADIPTQGFSGGMRRRLSISIALLGDPSIVFLDEPTTGMDPVSRREVWDMIAAAKKGRVIILTTHSMEEADCLGDRVAVMSHGRLQAIGSSLHLKSRFGKGYRLTMFSKDESATVDWVKQNAPAGTALTSSVEGMLLFQLPKTDDQQSIVDFFRAFEVKKSSLGVEDYSVALTTLEEVFLTLSDRDKFITMDELTTKRRRSGSNLKKGNELKVAAPSLAGVPLASVVTGNSPKLTRIGKFAQIRAVLAKTISYQLNQKLSCCFILFFPVVIMGLLILLDASLFQQFKTEALCGKNIKQSDCIDQGFDLKCAKTQVEFVQKLVTKPSIRVGEIQDFFRGGPGVNPNCDFNACYEGLEKADYRTISLSSSDAAVAAGLGSIVYNPSVSAEQAALFEFQSNLYFILSNDTCSTVFNEAFDSAIVCKDKKDNELLNCQKGVNDLISAQKRLQSEQGRSFGLEACARDATGQIKEPSQATLDKLNELINAQGVCLTEQFLQATTLFTTIDLETILQNVDGNRTTSGVLGEFSSTPFQDPITADFESNIVSAALDPFLATVLVGKTPFVDKLTLLDACLNIVLKNNLTATFGASLTDTFCTWAENRDLVLGVAFKTYSNTTVLNQGMFDSWFGKPFQSQFMKDQIPNLTPKTLYRQRHFYSQFTAYNFFKADTTNGEYSYTAYFNNSATQLEEHGNWEAVVMLMDSAITKFHTNKTVEISFKKIPSEFKCNRDQFLKGEEELDCPSLLPFFLQISILDFVGRSLLPYLYLIHSFIIVSLIVYEKETKLMMIMKMMGLETWSYWLVTYVWFLAQYMVMYLLIVLMGTAAGMNTFKLHDSAIIWLFGFSWANLLIAYSFFLSIFFSNSRTSTAVCFLLLLIFNTVFAELVNVLIQDPNSTEASYSSIIWLPPVAMLRAVFIMTTSGAFKVPITVDNYFTFSNGVFASTIGIMWAEWFACLVLVWYLEKVWVSGFGVSYPPLFFLQKEYWFGKKIDPTNMTDLRSIKYVPDVANSDFEKRMGDDCKAEYERVVDPNSDALVRIVRLNKRFGNGKLAVKALSLGINRNECFCLLGHNGAGKTTTINMMCGLFEPSAGNALVDSFSIVTDMSAIQARSGVCVQENILWESLSCRDHVLFFGRLKGLTGSALTKAASAALKAVNLKQFEYRAAGALSGGMKRRLSVANALIGEPMVVYLDEPSTGLDPASRRQLWEVVANAKGNKSIVLTTHSMEEAEVLADRVGVMALGELQCVGTSAELCRRFGKGYTVILTTSDISLYGEIDTFMKKNYPSSVLLEEPIGGTVKYEISREDIVIADVFANFESQAVKSQLSLSNWGITETTLEEVFLHLADLAHVSEELQKAPVNQGKFKDGGNGTSMMMPQAANSMEVKVEVKE